MTFDFMNMWRFLHYINKPSLDAIGPQLFKWGEFYILSPSYNLTSDDLWPWYMTFDHMNIQSVPYFINTPSLVSIGLQLFKWSHFHIFSLSYNLTSDDLWPHQRMRGPRLHLWPNFVWNPSKLWKVEPNVNLFSQQSTTTGDKVIPMCLSCNKYVNMVYLTWPHQSCTKV